MSTKRQMSNLRGRENGVGLKLINTTSVGFLHLQQIYFNDMM